MFCKYCGARQDEGGNFCQYCGAAVHHEEKVPDQKDVAVQKGGGIDIAQASSSQAVLVQSPPKGTGANKRNPPLFFVIICLLAVVVGIYLFAKFLVPSSTINLEDYFGLWAIDGTCIDDGGMVVSIEPWGYRAEIWVGSYYPYLSSGNREACVRWDLPLRNQHLSISDSLGYYYEDDGWGHSGKVVILFKKDCIELSVKEGGYTKGKSDTLWGLPVGHYTLSRNDDIFDVMNADLEQRGL